MILHIKDSDTISTGEIKQHVKYTIKWPVYGTLLTIWLSGGLAAWLAVIFQPIRAVGLSWENEDLTVNKNNKQSAP